MLPPPPLYPQRLRRRTLPLPLCLLWHAERLKLTPLARHGIPPASCYRLVTTIVYVDYRYIAATSVAAISTSAASVDTKSSYSYPPWPRSPRCSCFCCFCCLHYFCCKFSVAQRTCPWDPRRPTRSAEHCVPLREHADKKSGTGEVSAGVGAQRRA